MMKTLPAEKSETPSTEPALIVGIGASAGGLEALERLFDRMPEKTGCAFVVVQHLSPDFKSVMDEILARRTKIPIVLAEDGVALQRDVIFLNPAKNNMILRDGRLFLADKDPSEVVAYPIDHFFRSLAQDAGGRAVAIVLSGTGSDGSRGLRDVHSVGGTVLVQSPESSGFDGMPKRALETGLADRTLSPEEMPDVLLERLSVGSLAAHLQQPPATVETGMETIFRMLRDSYGIDFSGYKSSTILRRTERRAEMAGEGTIDTFASRLASDPVALDLLYRDLLIGVTRFFRDTAAFTRLTTEVLPGIVAAATGREEIRIWVAGCATGEEAYSIAMCLHETMEAAGRSGPVRIFATDVHQDSLRIASTGIYAAEALVDVTPERRQRFFVFKDGRYQITPEIRAMVVFASHNILKDAPFTHLDLVTCRNLLIYFEPPAQRKVLGMFHFGLKTQGYLFLGPSETTGDLAEEFDSLDVHWKIFRKRRDLRVLPEVRFAVAAKPGGVRPGRHSPPAPNTGDSALLGTYDTLLESFMPPCLLVGPRRELLHAFGGASRFLRLQDGRITNDVADMLEGDLRVAVLGALQRVFAERSPVVFKGMRVEMPGRARLVDVTARPGRNRRTGDLFAVVLLEEVTKAELPLAPTEAKVDQASRDYVTALETELKYSRENLQATIEELETSNEELQAANEELVASNEELQSTNEELHSVNEELHTVNGEFQRKISELMDLNADLDHLQASIEVHTLFVDQQLCIRRFTPKIAEAFNLLPQDVGRNIEVFTHTLQRPSLIEDIRRAASRGEPFEDHVQDSMGRWFLLRILPYRRGQNIEGAVLTLIDVTRVRRAEAEARRMELLLSCILRNSPNQIFIKDRERRYVLVDETFRRMTGKSPIGHTAAELFPGEVASALSAGDDDVFIRGTAVETEVTLPGRGGPHTYLCVKFPLRELDGTIIGVGGIHTDVTGLKNAEHEAREAVSQRDRFLATLSHELRNPLAAILNAAGILGRQNLGSSAIEWQRTITHGARHMARLLDDLLDLAHITQDKMAIERHQLDLRSVISAALEESAARIKEKRLDFSSQVDESPILISGDAARLRQVVANLLVNAIRYTPEGGKVSLSLKREGQVAVLRLTDNGVGISSHMLERVFEPFVQGHMPGVRGREGGMGVGLSLVRHIIALHDGTVSAFSAGEGNGSEFVVRLPCAPGALPQEEKPAVVPPSGLHVLLVEDDDESRRALEKLMTIDGLVVAAAESGEAALALFPQLKPEVVLLDIGLPGMDGYETCRRLRALSNGTPPLFVALTGFGQEADRTAAKMAGFDAHATKPLEVEEVYLLLEKLMRQAPVLTSFTGT